MKADLCVREIEREGERGERERDEGKEQRGGRGRGGRERKRETFETIVFVPYTVSSLHSLYTCKDESVYVHWRHIT